MPFEIHLCAKGCLCLLANQKEDQNSSWMVDEVVLTTPQTSVHSLSRSVPRKKNHCLIGTNSGVMRNSVQVRSHNFGFTVIKRVYSHKAGPQAPCWNSSPLESNENQHYKSQLSCGHMPEAVHRVLSITYGVGLPLIILLYFHLSLVSCFNCYLTKSKISWEWRSGRK